MNEAAAVRRRVVVLRTTLHGFANCAESYQRLYHYLPEPGSEAAREVEALESPAEETLSFAAVLLAGAQDHLLGLECLLAAESSVYAPYTVARALLESSARAWWLLDPNIDARERLTRTLTERLASLYEGAKLVRATARGGRQAESSRDLSKIDARIDHVVAVARRNDLPVIEDKRGRPVAVGAERLGATVIVAKLLAGQDGDMVFGEVAFRSWSGRGAHSMFWGLTAGLEHQLDPAGQHELIANLRMTLGNVEELVAIAAMAFGEAFNREVELYGWDRRNWDAYVRQALADLRSSIRPP